MERWSAVDHYFEALLVPDDPVIEGDVPAHGVSALQGKLLCLLARMVGARRILELGGLAGYSTIWLARGLAEGGRVVTLEVDAGYAEIARENLARAGMAERVEVVVGDDPSAHGVRRFAELVSAEPRLAATAIQTVGGKGYDGLLLALVS